MELSGVRDPSPRSSLRGADSAAPFVAPSGPTLPMTGETFTTESGRRGAAGQSQREGAGPTHGLAGAYLRAQQGAGGAGGRRLRSAHSRARAAQQRTAGRRSREAVQQGGAARTAEGRRLRSAPSREAQQRTAPAHSASAQRQRGLAHSAGAGGASVARTGACGRGGGFALVFSPVSAN